VNRLRKPSAWDIAYSISMGIACLLAFVAEASMLKGFTNRDNELLGGMWAAAASAFVFRDTGSHSLAAGLARFIATSISLLLCLPYLWFLAPSALGIPILVVTGTLLMILLNRPDDIITTAITTIVVMAVAILSPANAWEQPLLRCLDTAVGIVIGVICRQVASSAFNRREHRFT